MLKKLIVLEKFGVIFGNTKNAPYAKVSLAIPIHNAKKRSIRNTVLVHESKCWTGRTRIQVKGVFGI